MATTTLLPLEEDITCPICCEVFKNPVALKCSHSFCEGCLQQYWSDQKVLQCPVCRKECSAEEPTKNLAFKNLCETFKSRRFAAPSGNSCPEHDEKLKLYCYEDKQPICVVCYTSKKHRNHQCAPIVEAVQDLKADFKSRLPGMLQNLQTLIKSKEEWQSLGENIKDEKQNVEKLLRQEFESLHQFLREEEEARIAALSDEEMENYEKTKNKVETLSCDISNLSLAIQTINQQLEMEEFAFLESYTSNPFSTFNYTLPKPGRILGINKVKHLGILNLNLQAKMYKLLHELPPLVILDPNTASNKLVVSENLKSVSYMEQKQNVPDNPERLIVGVLGFQGFSSGLHRWDVDVGDNDHWTIGVVKQSVERKKLLKTDPSGGLWSIRFISGKYRVGLKSRKELFPPEKPQIIRVELDYDEGLLTFSVPSDGFTLYTFTSAFTETLFPYFNTASTICPIHIS